MKTWGIITAIFYGLIIAALMPPLDYFSNSDSKFAQIYFMPEFWLYAAIIIAGEVLLIIVPVDISERRNVSRRKLWIPVITSAFFMAVLALTILLSAGAAIRGDNIFGKQKELTVGLSTLAFVFGVWAFWAFIFYRNYIAKEPGEVIRKLVLWMSGGSVLGLLVAVPSHIIVRQRGDCCAPGITFIGIVTGLSVLLLSFGPGIIFLYAKKIKNRKNSGQ